MNELTSKDIQILRGHLKPDMNDYIVLFFFILFSPLIPALFGLIIGVDNNPHPIFEGYYIYWLTPIGLILFLYLLFRFINRNIRMDLKNNVKTQLTRRIIKKTQTKISSYAHKGSLPNQSISGSFMDKKIKAGEFKGKVSAEMYEQLNTGDEVTIIVAPKSRIILEVEIELNNASKTNETENL